MITHKKCKGTGKAKSHGCGELVDVRYRKYGLGTKCCYGTWLLNSEEGKELLSNSQIVAKKKVAREYKKKDRIRKEEFREDNKSIRQLINEARIPFQKFIRMRDANHACISCGLAISALWDAGHFYKAELYTGLIFDEDNVHKQCRKCNTYLGGNENNYRIRLIAVKGREFVEALDAKSDAARLHRYTKDELREIRNKYRELLKQ
jgi:hypothetical protein